MPNRIHECTSRVSCMCGSAAEEQLAVPPVALISSRAALVCVIAILFGAAGGWLTFLAGDNVPAVVLAGLSVTGLAVPKLHTHIGR